MCFLATSVDYLGVKVDAERIHPLPEKVRAIMEATGVSFFVAFSMFVRIIFWFFLIVYCLIVAPRNVG